MVEFTADYGESGVEFKDETFDQEAIPIVHAAVDDIFQGSLSYNYAMVGQWSGNICDRIMTELVKLSLPRKYVATCHFIQKNGAGVSTAISTYWDAEGDGHYTYVKENTGLLCITTVYGCLM
eukprot:NODE_8174_length_529_cov_7.333333_g7120_i0.p1 GENE.NODE_8174_length_529_cov_7.333333_g7120_i0~~NODE_8174_length_529_cov_7.333333_g7120_i0.p1  ORF type:complete len:122 (+),score=21.14 NODE_8174_length_529_cov_7.333333_g7120_i0:74-439(+)